MLGRPHDVPVPADTLPQDLSDDIEAAGYYPALVADVVATAVAGQEVLALSLIHI